MTVKASGRSGLLAIGLLIGLASASQAGTDNMWPQVASPQASTTDTSTAAAPQSVDPAPTPGIQLTQTAATSEQDTQVQSVVPVVARSDENSPSDTSSLIGKIFIGFGALLTLGSSAARMFMA